jgi:hypothetical protein
LAPAVRLIIGQRGAADSPREVGDAKKSAPWSLAAALALALLGCGSVPGGKDAGPTARDTGTTNAADAGASDVAPGNVDGDDDSAATKPTDGPGSPDGAADRGPFDLGPSAATWDFSNTTWDNSVWN